MRTANNYRGVTYPPNCMLQFTQQRSNL